MVYEPSLLDRLESLEPRPFDGVVWRHMFAGLDPTRANTRGSRWNPPDVAAIYTSLERDTAQAEGDYAVASQPVRPRATRQLYEVHVTLERVLDLTEPGLLAELGVSDVEMASRDQGPCRTVGGAAHWLGCDGVLVPSARASGTNLVVFADRMDVDAALEIRRREEIE